MTHQYPKGESAMVVLASGILSDINIDNVPSVDYLQNFDLAHADGVTRTFVRRLFRELPKITAVHLGAHCVVLERDTDTSWTTADEETVTKLTLLRLKTEDKDARFVKYARFREIYPSTVCLRATAQ